MTAWNGAPDSDMIWVPERKTYRGGLKFGYETLCQFPHRDLHTPSARSVGSEGRLTCIARVRIGVTVGLGRHIKIDIL